MSPRGFLLLVGRTAFMGIVLMVPLTPVLAMGFPGEECFPGNLCHGDCICQDNTCFLGPSDDLNCDPRGAPGGRPGAEIGRASCRERVYVLV